MRTVLASGTLLDKLSALSMLIQREPLYSLKNLGVLMKMAMKNSKREAELAITTLKQVFIEHLLPKNQKLRTFPQYLESSAPDKRTSKETLIKAFIEHSIKTAYKLFLKRVYSLTSDTVLHIKKTMMKLLLDLLIQRPEEEKTLLSMVIEKYGDKDKKVGQYVSTLLKQLLRAHPNMTVVVLQQLGQFVSKGVNASNVTTIVKFVNKLEVVPATILRQVLEEKIRIYFGLMNMYLKMKKGETEEKTTEKLLKGLVLLAEKYKSKMDDLNKYVNEHSKDLYKLSYTGELKSRIYALKLLLAIEGDRKNTPSNRFYRSLYELQFSIELMDSSMLEQFFVLLLQGISHDSNAARVSAILKRLLQHAGMAPVNYTIAGLLVTHRAAKVHPSIVGYFGSKESAGPDDEEELFRDVPDSDAPEEAEDHKIQSDIKSLYDWHKRDPQYANAEKSCFWELSLLCAHYHPLVSKWAKELLKNGGNAELDYDGKNPILDFKVINLLDRMTYKEPKKKIGKSTPRISNTATPISNHWKSLQIGAGGEGIKPHEEFFAKYFENRQKRQVSKRKDTEDMDEIADEIIKGEMEKIGGDPDMDDLSDQEPFSDLEDEGEKWDLKEEKLAGKRRNPKKQPKKSSKKKVKL
eukprot:TRINITY_DN9847_c0_g3_i1.p1 TRINITY_DN9847_c0_g3~~TRINITY_DN9847_c0_g3_i1.p1  ORF type:complete len:634 (-),score=171.88 TRINITY_DN9847_c0_g3_i1:71-1972(-)